jgi:fibronectin-binding autotransporter adhesin
MKASILSWAIVLTIVLGALNAVYAGSATWDLNPISGDWNTAINWMPPTVPNGPDDVATFGLSNQTSVSTSADIEVSSIVFDSSTSGFTITNPFAEFIVSGIGIVNNSTVLQNVVNPSDSAGNAGLLRFTGNATAGNLITYTNEGAVHINGAMILFEDNSTAATAQFVNIGGLEGNEGSVGLISFSGTSTAANGNFTNTADAQHDGFGKIEFHENATAANGTFANEQNGVYGHGGWVQFFDNTTADHATFTNKPAFLSAVSFYGNSTAANATIVNEGGTYYTLRGYTEFFDSSTASDGLFIVNGSLTTFFGYAYLSLGGNSKAGNGTFIANGGQVAGASGGNIYIEGNSSAENGIFIANGGMVSGAEGARVVFLLGAPTAAGATLIANGGVGTGAAEGGGIAFDDDSTGAEARVELFGNGFLDIRAHATPRLTIGSLEGDGFVFLGGANLFVGRNNLSSEFSGLIEENSEGATGAITKIGTGILMLTSANTYTGGTTIEGGKLVVDNRTGSATGSGTVQVNAGILAGRGTIFGPVNVGTGSGSGAALAPGRRGTKTDTLTILSALIFQLDSTYKFELKSSTATADKVVANGITINSGAQFSPGDLALLCCRLARCLL